MTTVAETPAGQPAAEGPDGETYYPLQNPAEALRLAAVYVLGARQRAESLKSTRAFLRRQWEQEHAELLDQYEAAKAEVERRETQLRELAVTVFQATGSKDPLPGVVKVRVYRKPRYDRAAALEWAIGRRLFLALDTEPFEKFARDQHAQVADFVEIVEEPAASIAQDLSAALQAKGGN